MNMPNVIQPQPETADAVNWLANNDLKALSFVGLVELRESTTTQLARAVSERTLPEALQSVSAYPVTFAKANFADVRPGIGSNTKPANYYTATRASGALAVIGSLVEWSETHDYPLVTMLSTTASKGESSAPVNTVQILDGMERGLAIADMNLPGYKPTEKGGDTAVNSRLVTMVKLGLVEATDEPAAVRIIDPSYKGTWPFDKLKPGRQGFYRTVTLARDLKPDEKWTVEQLTQLAYKYQFVTDESDVDFQDALMRAVSIRAPRYAVGVLEKQEIKPRKYSVSEQYAAMVHDLVERVAKVDSSPRYAAETRDYATDVYQTPVAAARVANRSLVHSSHRKR